MKPPLSTITSSSYTRECVTVYLEVSSSFPCRLCFFAFQSVSAIRGQLARIWRENILAKVQRAFGSKIPIA
jgi:hypothetical protein